MLDLSKATKLKEVVFQAAKPSVLWILVTLQTVRSKDLQNISIHHNVGPYDVPNVPVEFLPEWWHLDRSLVQFWALHLMRPKFFDETRFLKDATPTLFPELTSRGLLDVARSCSGFSLIVWTKLPITYPHN